MKRGHIREDGWIFYGYRKRPAGIVEVWNSPEAWNRRRIGTMCNDAKFRAKKAGIPFDLTQEHLHAIYPKDGCCPVLGLPLVWGWEFTRNNSPSLDRIHPGKGYVMGNVRIISNRANTLKNDATPEELERVLIDLKEIASSAHQ